MVVPHKIILSKNLSPFEIPPGPPQAKILEGLKQVQLQEGITSNTVKDVSSQLSQLNLNKKLVNRLDKKLDLAIKQFEAGRLKAAESAIRSFTHQVIAQTGKGIPAASAQQLIEPFVTSTWFQRFSKLR
jgi:hypothetical protein